jgi:hypothetical protein
MQVLKGFLEAGNQVYLLILGQSSGSWVRIRIPNTYPDLGEPNQCGFLRIQI